MSDALSLLRHFVRNKKEFHEDDDKIVFGDVYYPKSVKTTYLIYGTGKDGKPKDYYTLECLAFLIKHRDLQHPMYVKSAGTRNISVVSRPDRRDLLSFLDGEVETLASIDKNAPLEIAMQRPLPYVKSSATISSSSASAAISQDVEMTDLASSSREGMDVSAPLIPGIGLLDSKADARKDQVIDRLTKKFDETAAQSQRPITENIQQLSEQLTKEKIAAIKAKKKAQQRKQVNVDIDDEIGASSSLIGGTMSAFGTGSAATGVLTSEQIATNDAIMRAMLRNEIVGKTRFTVLQSSGKQFEKDINAFLQQIKAKEDGAASIDGLQNVSGQQAAAMEIKSTAPAQNTRVGYNRFDQERYAGKDETGGFGIDTKLTYQPLGGAGIALTPNPSAPTPVHESSSYPQQVTAPAAQKQVINNSVSKPTAVSVNQTTTMQKRTHTKPIIIIPNTPTSMITMYNVIDILQELKYVPSEDKKKQTHGMIKDSEIILHKRENGQTIQFKVIDNINKLTPQDWY